MQFKKKFVKGSDFKTVTKRPLAQKLKKDLVRVAHDIDRNGNGDEYVDVLKEFLSQFSNQSKTSQRKTKQKTESEDTKE